MTTGCRFWFFVFAEQKSVESSSHIYITMKIPLNPIYIKSSCDTFNFHSAIRWSLAWSVSDAVDPTEIR